MCVEWCAEWFVCLLSGLLSIGCVRDRDDVSVLLMVVVVHGSMEDRGGWHGK